MKKIFLGTSLLLLAPLAGLAAPEVSNVVMTQDLATRAVTVTYDLAGESAIITLDVLTNNVSIGAHNISFLSGDVTRMVSPGTGKSLT